MDKLKIALSFIKIRLKNIGSALVKGSTAYIIASFGLIQVSSIVADNIDVVQSIGISKELFMQYLFISLLFLFPVFLIFTIINKLCIY